MEDASYVRRMGMVTCTPVPHWASHPMTSRRTSDEALQEPAGITYEAATMVDAGLDPDQLEYPSTCVDA